MASARSVSRPCRRMVCPDLSRAVFYKYLFPFRFEKTASSESRELSPPSPSMFARTRAPHPACSWKRQVWQALSPLTDQSNSRYRCQAQLPTITRQAPGPPAARSTRVSSPQLNFRAGILGEEFGVPAHLATIDRD